MKFSHFPVLSALFFVMILCDASASNPGKHKGINEEKTFIASKKFPLNSTIRSPDGDIINCIDMYQQPAFDHPLLRDHIILTRPSYYRHGFSGDQTNPVTQLWRLGERCPEGTIPIRRTENEDLFRANSGNKYPRRNFSQSSSPNDADPQDYIPDPKSYLYEHSFVYVFGNKYYGAKANINIWQPQLQHPVEFSLAQIWVFGGPFSELNTVEAGWHVHPSLYGDNNTRLFIFWMSDGYHSLGCFNLHCAGFVQTAREVLIGGTISPVSTYLGPQYEAPFAIWKDSSQNAWWLSVWGTTVGYWPACLFTHLADSASAIQWGGEVLNAKPDGQHTASQMGSGHFPEEDFGGASYFTNVEVIDESGNSASPGDEVRSMAEAPGCYKITANKSDAFGYYFLYGGPGRNLDCP